jgi:predicted nucleotidyltransferase
MIDVLENQKEAIAELCRKYNVEKLFAFGSAIRDDYRPGESDVDLLVEFSPIGGHAKFHAYFDMLDELQQLLGSKVDLVMSGAVRNAVIAHEIERTKRMIYAS